MLMVLNDIQRAISNFLDLCCHLAIIAFEVVPIRAYALFSALLPFFKCILEVVFCEGIQHFLRFCPCHFSCVRMAAFQFCLQSEKQKSMVGEGGTLLLFFIRNSLVKNEV
jgi:hypothetical protein